MIHVDDVAVHLEPCVAFTPAVAADGPCAECGWLAEDHAPTAEPSFEGNHSLRTTPV